MLPEPPTLDPRIRRTRQMLFTAMEELLSEKDFEDISVQDIADRSTVNRATFYDHFPDKFALLETLIDETFRARFIARMAGSDGTCRAGLRQLILAVCDFLAETVSACQRAQRQFDPMVEARIKTILRDFLAAGLRKHGASDADIQLRSTMAAWAICGSAFDWKRKRDVPAETCADAMLPIILPILHLE